jgi:hypothetical protein
MLMCFMPITPTTWTASTKSKLIARVTLRRNKCSATITAKRLSYAELDSLLVFMREQEHAGGV